MITIVVDPLVLFGAIGTAVTAVVGAGIKKVWVWGWTLKDKDDDLEAMTKDRDFWQDLCLQLAGVNEAAVKALASEKAKAPK